MVPSKTARKRVDEFVETCRRRGIKATHQRTEILRELAGTDAHPDAESIYTRVRERIPAISRDTVYRTLHMLEDMGIISRVGPVQDRARFDANNEEHHHFICTGCGRIQDFHSEGLDRFRVPPDVRSVGRVDSVHVEVRGLCGECALKAGKRA